MRDSDRSRTRRVVVGILVGAALSGTAALVVSTDLLSAEELARHATKANVFIGPITLWMRASGPGNP